MSYRIVRIANLYKEYINNYYLKNPDVSHLDYNTQQQNLINDSVEIASSYNKYLRKLGVDAIDIISNADHLQQKWLTDHNLSPNISFFELIIEQLKYYKPDIVWIDDTRLLNKDWIKELRIKVPSLRLVVGHICAPFNALIADSLSSFDIMFNCAPFMQKKFLEMGLNTHSIYHSFDHSLLNIIENDTKFVNNDFIFTGSLYTGFGLHKTRIEYLEKFVSEKINISVYGNVESRYRIFQKQSMYLLINTLKSLGLEGKLESLPYLRKYSKYGDDKIKYYSKELLDSIKPPVFESSNSLE